MDLITVTVKYNVSTFLWNMTNPQEFWNHKLQDKIFTLAASFRSLFWGDPSTRWSNTEHFFCRTKVLWATSGILNFAFEIEGSSVHLWESQAYAEAGALVIGLWVGCFFLMDIDLLRAHFTFVRHIHPFFGICKVTKNECLCSVG